MRIQAPNNKEKNFFLALYELWLLEGYDNFECLINRASQKAKMDLQTVLNTLNDVQNQRLKHLSMIDDSGVTLWFRVNSGNLANITKKMLNRESA